MDRGTMYPDRLTCLLAVAMGRDGRHWKREQPRVAGRRALWRVAMVGWRTNMTRAQGIVGNEGLRGFNPYDNATQ